MVLKLKFENNQKTQNVKKKKKKKKHKRPGHDKMYTEAVCIVSLPFTGVGIGVVLPFEPTPPLGQ